MCLPSTLARGRFCPGNSHDFPGARFRKLLLEELKVVEEEVAPGGAEIAEDCGCEFVLMNNSILTICFVTRAQQERRNHPLVSGIGCVSGGVDAPMAFRRYLGHFGVQTP